jgi:hypothetical protein
VGDAGGSGGLAREGGADDVDDSSSNCSSSSSSASATSWSLDDGAIFDAVPSKKVDDNYDDDEDCSISGGVFDDWGNTGTRDLAWDDDDDSSLDNHDDDDQDEMDDILLRFGKNTKIAAGGRFSTTARSSPAILFLAQDSRF